MERWDFDCQRCGRSIGDFAYVAPEWYQCSQDRHMCERLGSVYPHTLFSIRDGKLTFDDAALPEEYKDFLLGRIKEYFEHGVVAVIRLGGKPEPIDVHKIDVESARIDKEKKTLEGGVVTWYERAREAEYREKAGVVEHKIKGRGWGRLGYAFDARCAEELEYKCDVCDSDLEKVVADQHPGGQWGIRGIREPAPMR